MDNHNRRSRTHFMFPINSLVLQNKKKDFFLKGNEKKKSPFPQEDKHARVRYFGENTLSMYVWGGGLYCIRDKDEIKLNVKPKKKKNKIIKKIQV